MGDASLTRSLAPRAAAEAPASGAHAMELGPLDARLLNHWQRDFPLQPEPFDLIALSCGVDADTVRHAYRRLLQRGAASRIGGVWAAGAGGAALLCAMAVPPARLEAVAARVSAHPGVNHNYEREHRFNLWFVITGRDRDEVDQGVLELEQATDVAALRLRMVRAYRIDLGFDLGLDSKPAAHHAPSRPVHAFAPVAVRSRDHALAALVEDGVPLIARPYDAWAQALGRTRDDVIDTLRSWLREGTLRRFGVVVRHHELGFDANAMTVFDVPDAAVDACGAALARQPGVTLCYRRERAEAWPYNLYCMVHGRTRETVQQLLERAIAEAGLRTYAHCVLFSRRRFKQQGGRYFRAPPPETAHGA